MASGLIRALVYRSWIRGLSRPRLRALSIRAFQPRILRSSADALNVVVICPTRNETRRESTILARKTTPQPKDLGPWPITGPSLVGARCQSRDAKHPARAIP